MFVNSPEFYSSFIFICENHFSMPLNDGTLIDVELHGKCSTDCENSDSTSCSIISRSGLEIFV